MNIAAIQMKAKLGDIDANLKSAESLSREAFLAGAELVILPEFFTSAAGFHRSLLNSAQPNDGSAIAMLKELAREYCAAIGGSFILYCDGESFNTFVLAFPDGSLYYHDKDQPTMWENCYYIGGTDDGILRTPLGTIGAAMCWEFIRTRTAKRLIDKVKLVVGGTCWWSLPEKWIPGFSKKLSDKNLSILQDTPSTFARLLGVPVVHASHAGDFSCGLPMLPGFPYKSYFLGETQIVDATGNIMARMKREEGEGFIIADINIDEKHEPSEKIPDRFWIPDLPFQLKFAWWYQNLHGRIYYRLKTKPYRKKSFAKK
jgi:N-carbamoylputrescine amidase